MIPVKCPMACGIERWHLINGLQQGGAARRNACEGVERMCAYVSSRNMAYTFRWAKCKYFLLIYCHLGLAKCH